MVDTRIDFWNSPFYKPKNKIHPDFWEEFMRASYIVRERYRRNPTKFSEPSVYDVFDWMRQELHGELPYTAKRCDALDQQIEREFARNAKRAVSNTPRGS